MLLMLISELWLTMVSMMPASSCDVTFLRRSHASTSPQRGHSRACSFALVLRQQPGQSGHVISRRYRAPGFPAGCKCNAPNADLQVVLVLVASPLVGAIRAAQAAHTRVRAPGCMYLKKGLQHALVPRDFPSKGVGSGMIRPDWGGYAGVRCTMQWLGGCTLGAPVVEALRVDVQRGRRHRNGFTVAVCLRGWTLLCTHAMKRAHCECTAA